MAGLRGSVSAVLPGDSLQDFLDQAADMGGSRVDNYTLYQDFYDGKRGALLRDRAREYLERTSVPFCENFCDVAVDTLAERLRVVGFSSSESADDHDPVGRTVEGWWRANRMDGLQVVAHTQALMKGDEFVIVEWDDARGIPRFCRQHQHQVKMVYSDDEQDTIEYAVKGWNTRKRAAQNVSGRSIRRLNLYFPDRVEKWFRPDSGGGGGGWEQWQDPGDEVWPVWWTDTRTEDGDPLGVPVVHIRHRPLGSGYGRSRIRMAIPFQLELNKYAADLNDLIDNHALPQDWVTGVTGDTSYKRVAGNLWQATGENARFGRLEATPTSNLLEAIEGVLSRLARRMRIPMHLLTGGTPPSGESLKTAESGLVATAKACQVEFGNAWEDATMIALRLEAAFGDGPDLPDDLSVEAQWANPEARSDEADLRAATLKKELGVSKHTLLTELGYDPEKEAEVRSGEAEEAQAAFGKFLGGPADE